MRVNRVQRATGSTKRPWRDPKCMKCRKEILKGEPYQWAQGFRGPKMIICGSCVFSRADLTNSKLSTVYEAFDSAYDELAEADESTDLQSILDSLVGSVQEVADEYRSAADEYFSGGGPNAEKADEVESCVDELDSIDVPELVSFEQHCIDAEEEQSERQWRDWIQEQIDTFRGDIENADSL